jgi:hypothetical protein
MTDVMASCECGHEFALHDAHGCAAFLGAFALTHERRVYCGCKVAAATAPRRREGVSEAEACRWLGRRATLIAPGADAPVTGRIEHVSTRSVFVMEESWDVVTERRVRLVPFGAIERIVGADPVEAQR